MAAEGVAKAIGPWPHVLWLVPRFIVGFVFGFLYVPVLRGILQTGTLAWAPPFALFTGFFDLITLNSTYLYSLVIISIIGGFFAIDLVIFWNRLLRGILLVAKMERIYLMLYPWVQRNVIRAQSQTRAVHSDLTTLQTNTRFRVWLLSTDRGARVQYLDSNGFYKNLTAYYKHAFLFFLQLWIVWGMVAILDSVLTGAIAETGLIANIWQGLQYLFILGVALAFYWLSRQQSIVSANITDKTWVDLFEWFKESESTRNECKT